MEKVRSSPLSFFLPWLAPLVIKFAIEDSGVEVQFYRNNRLLKNRHAAKLCRTLPEPLTKWIDDQHISIGPQPYPLARQLWQTLLPLASESFIIDASALAELEEISQPHDFALIWTLNRSLVRIEGRYEGMDRYLGMGWFQKNTKIWSLKNNPSNTTDAPFKNLIMPIQQADLLLKTTLPYLQNHLPTRADFQFITDFALLVTVASVRSRELTFILQCNYPQFLPTIQVPQQKVDILLANKTIIQFPHQALTPLLIQLLQNGSSITIRDAAIPLFISEQLPIMRQYHQINEDMAAKIIQFHPIVPIATLRPSPSFSHTYENGIGKYTSVATYQYQQHILDMDALLAARKQNQRFVQQHAAWFEWPQNSTDLFTSIQLQRTKKVLQPDEVMGFNTQRVTFLDTQSATGILQLSGTTSIERSQSFSHQLRYHGIPGGIVAEYERVTSTFINVCENLLHDNRQARILWLAPSNKKGSVTRAINNSVLSSYVTVASLVTLRDELALISHSWTLVIFQVLDQLLDGSSQARMLSLLKWKWALTSVTSKRALSPSIMPVLHLSEQYYEQFCTRYLFDLERSYNSPASGKSTSGLNTAQPVSPTVPKKEEALRPAISPSSTPVRPTSTSETSSPSNASPKLTPSRSNSFWEQARQWQGRSHTSVPLEKFKCYYPTYSDMDTKQLDWYFYWRNEIRNDRYPTTTLSYIFVHIYEALACIGFATPALAFKRITALWNEYRNSFPLLDQYLIPWIADFCVIYQSSDVTMQWYTVLLTVPNCAVDEQLIAEAWLRQGGDWGQMPEAVLYKLAGFNIQTKFYQENQQKHALDEGYRLAIHGIDEYLSAKFGAQGLVARYGRGILHAVEREPFKGALVERAYPPIIVANINAVFNNVEFRRALSGILKYADYIQRKMYQSTALPIAPTIDVSWQEVIESILTNKSSGRLKNPADKNVQKPFAQTLHSSIQLNVEIKQKPGQPDTNTPAKPAPSPIGHTIKLDQKQIAKLNQESEQLQERLTVEDEDPTQIVPLSVPLVPPVQLRPEAKREPEQASMQHRTNTQISPAQIRTVPDSVKSASSPMSRPTVQLNPEAIAKLREESEQLQERLTVEGEEEQEQAQMISVPDPVPVTPIMSNVIGPAPEVDEDWQIILQQWQPEHWEIILLLHQEEYMQLATVGRRVHRPVSQIIDEINLPVDEQLGDLLVDPDTETISTHLHATVESLVRWYLSSNLNKR